MTQVLVDLWVWYFVVAGGTRYELLPGRNNSTPSKVKQVPGGIIL